MISGTVCHKCVKAAAESVGVDYDSVAGIRVAFTICRDRSKPVVLHPCCGVVEDEVGGYWGCSCLQPHVDL